MSETFTTLEIRSTMRTLRDYLRDLLAAGFEQFQTKLRLFVNFCEKDEVMRVLARDLHLRAGDVRAWFAGVVAGGAIELPKDAARRLAHQYMSLSEMKRQGIDVRNFISTLYSTQAGGFLGAFASFKSEWLEPFANELLRRVEAIEAALPKDPSGKVDLDQVVARALERAEETVKAPARAGAKKAAAAAAKAPKVEDLVDSLEATVKKTKELVAGARKDIEKDLKILKLALSKGEPSKEVVLAVVRPLERLGGKIAEIASAIESRVSK